VERAGNASFHSRDPSDPLSPLQLDAAVDWNADTGATSHMTPHHHWLCHYSPKCVPIKLADNTVVYSAGVGSVVFHPTLEGKRGRAVEFSNVLHIPQLRNNLFAVLYLTRRSFFDVHINATHMSFSRSNGPPLFVPPSTSTMPRFWTVLLRRSLSMRAQQQLSHWIWLCGIEDSPTTT
jgi:hypothetical protein